jgi:uncharacterized repeat protein (TIGR03806 family)
MLAVLLMGCGSGAGTSGSNANEALSEYGFFAPPMASQIPAAGVHPYEVNSPLWSDNAAKLRFIALPEGSAIAFSPTDPWGFPEGSTLIKTFLFPVDFNDPEGPRRLVETRLLVFEEGEWTGHVYVWNDEQTEATRHVPGKFTTVAYKDAEGVDRSELYVIPNTNQCKGCHGNDDRTLPIGSRTRQLNRDVIHDGESVNQLQRLSDAGLFAELPAMDESWEKLADPAGDADLDSRARSWMEANCAHCHQPGGDGGTSGLVLLASETHPTKIGICKGPVAAGPGSGGRFQDIVPGKPEESILVYRIASTDPEIKMPEIPNLLVDEFGLQLVSDWIAAMDPPGCPQ